MVTEFNINNITEEFNDFKTKLKKEMKNGKILKTKFDSILPKYLKTDAKMTLLKNIKKEYLNEKDIIKFLKKQTMGKDFMNFDILLEWLDIKTNASHFPIFNNDLKFTEIKKEALYIWWIINILKNNTFIKKYWHYITGELQRSLDVEISGNNSRKYDLCFIKIGVLIEIDEEGHGTITITNDLLKDSLARMNGSALLRLNTKSICHINSKDEYIENTENMVLFSDILINVVMGSLMRFEDIRKERLKDLFEDDIILDMEEIAHKINQKKILMSSLDSTSSEYEYHKKRLDGLKTALNKKRTIFRSFKGDLAMQLFDLKRRTETSKSKIINIDEVYEVFSISKDDADKRTTLYEFIEDNGLFDDNDCISWENLSFVIFEFEDEEVIDISSRKILAEYYRKVEKNYEIIVKDIITYYKQCIPNIETYKNYIEHVEEYLFDKLKKENENLKQENSLLKIERDDYKNKFEFYDKRKEDIMVEQLYHECKSSYCLMLIAKLQCIRYDFFSEYTKDEVFEKELDDLSQTIKDFVTKYDKYYNSYTRQPRKFAPRYDKAEILKKYGNIINEPIVKSNNKYEKNNIEEDVSQKIINEDTSNDSDGVDEDEVD